MTWWHRMGRALVAAVVLAWAGTALAQGKLKDVTIVYPAPSSTSWPIFMAKDGGYFEKYGLNAKVEFGLHPAGPVAVASGEALTHNLGLDTSMLAAMQGQQIMIVASPLNVGQFVLLGAKDIPDVKAIAGKRIAIGRVGDPPYFYAQGLLDAMKIDSKAIQWVGAGTPQQRALAVKNGLADAAMLTPPDYYQLQDDGFKILASFAEHRELPISTSYMWRRKTVTEEPELVEAVLKAHAEGVKRFYDDKAFSVAMLKKWISVDDATASRLWEETTRNKVFERIPYVTTQAIDGIVARGKAETPALASFDFHKVIDQGPIDRLVASGFYEQLFGTDIKAEIADRKAGAFK